MAYNILILGAAYGSLLASKMLFGGHKIHHICLPAEADLINAEGFRVRLPVKGRKDPVLLESRKLPGKVTASGASGVNPSDYDLVGLAMQEPQYRSPGVRELLDAVAKSRVPHACRTRNGASRNASIDASLIDRAPKDPPKTSTQVSVTPRPKRARAASRSVTGGGTGRPVTTYFAESRPAIGNARQTRRARPASNRLVSPRWLSASISTSGTRPSTAASPTGPAT